MFHVSLFQCEFYQLPAFFAYTLSIFRMYSLALFALSAFSRLQIFQKRMEISSSLLQPQQDQITKNSLQIRLYYWQQWQPRIELILGTLGFQLIKSMNQLFKREKGERKIQRGGKLGFTCRRFLIEVSRSRGKLSISARCYCVAINRPERNPIPVVRMR